MDRRKNRSDSYQYLLLERACSSEFLDSFNTTSSATSSEEQTELEKDLQEQALRRVIDIINNIGTPHQKDVSRLTLDGYCQLDICRILNIGLNNSSIVKCLKGNVDYKKHKRYGGLGKKLLAACLLDIPLKRILSQLYTFDNQGSVYHLMWKQFSSEQKFINWFSDVPPPPPPPPPPTPRQKAKIKYNLSPKGRETNLRWQRQYRQTQLYASKKAARAKRSLSYYHRNKERINQKRNQRDREKRRLLKLSRQSAE